MSQLVGTLLGLMVAGGVVLLVVGLTPRPPRPPRPRRTVDWAQRWARLRTEARNGAIGAAAGLALGLALGVPVLALVGALLGITVPPLFGKPPSAQVVARGEVIETWVRGLSGMLTGGIGLEEAIRSSLPSTPPLIRPEVARLVARLQAQQPTAAALRRWADDLDDRTADLVAATLVLGAETRRGGMSQALRGLTESLSEQNRVLRRIEADRAGVRLSARLISVISLAMLVFVVIGPFGDPYRALLGQLVLLLLGVAYAGILAWMARLIAVPSRPRFLSDPSHRAEALP